MILKAHGSKQYLPERPSPRLREGDRAPDSLSSAPARPPTASSPARRPSWSWAAPRATAWPRASPRPSASAPRRWASPTSARPRTRRPEPRAGTTTGPSTSAAKAAGLTAISLDGDAFSKDMKARVAQAARELGRKFDLVIYSLASPVRTDPGDGRALQVRDQAHRRPLPRPQRRRLHEGPLLRGDPGRDRGRSRADGQGHGRRGLGALDGRAARPKASSPPARRRSPTRT